MKIGWENLWNQSFWPKSNFFNNWPKSEDHTREWEKVKLVNLWLLGVWWWGLHPALWQPQISSQKRLNLYSIFFIRAILFIKHAEQEREKQLGFERFCANGSKLRSFSRITGLHFATQSDPNFLLWQNVYSWNSQLSLKFPPTKFEVMSKV